MKRPNIITFGHEKGGTGKSTLTIHFVVSLIHRGFNVSIIDLDMRQANTYNFFKKRSENPELKQIDKLIGLKLSANNSRQIAYEEDLSALTSSICNCVDSDFIILDTAGSNYNFTRIAVAITDILITPLSDSLLDIDVLVKIDGENKRLNFGAYSQTVFEQKKNRIVNKKPPLKWLVVRNKVSPLDSVNKRHCVEILNLISTKIGFTPFNEIKDRVIYKNVFISGITVFDRMHAIDITSSEIEAITEINKLTEKILESLGEKSYKITSKI